MASVPARERDASLGSRAQRIRAASLGLVIAQYVLGISYNLYGTAPTASKKVDAFSSPLLAAHVIVGILLVPAAIYLVVAAVRGRLRLAVITSVTGLLSPLAAWVARSAFTQKGAAGYSMAMGALTAAALLCYVVNVCAFGGRTGSYSTACSTTVCSR